MYSGCVCVSHCALNSESKEIQKNNIIRTIALYDGWCCVADCERQTEIRIFMMMTNDDYCIYISTLTLM